MRRKLMWWTGAVVCALLAAVVVLDRPQAEAAIEPYCTPGTSCWQCCHEWANSRCYVPCTLFPPDWCEACHVPKCSECFRNRCMDRE